jgi:ATP-dependent RNA helicase RhlE
LANQVSESLHSVGKSSGLRIAVVIGGASEALQKRALMRNPRVIIATPGRLVDFLEQRAVSLGDVQILVLDEADRMLDMGFAPQINKILRAVRSDRQTMLFSATMPIEILDLAYQHMKMPINIEIAPSGTAADNVVQEVFFIERESKTRLLEFLLTEFHGSVLVFTRTKYGARSLTRRVRAMGHSAAEIHSNRSLGQRRDALEGFKSGKYRILIATDIAARGIDVVGIELVVNYELPNNSQEYVHRIGRTARAGMAGRAISFATYDQQNDIRDIERLIKTGLSIKEVPLLPGDSATYRRKVPVLLQEQAKKNTSPFGRSLKKGFGRGRRRR